MIALPCVSNLFCGEYSGGVSLKNKSALDLE